MLFEVTTTTDPRGVVVVSLLGDLDMASAPRFRHELLAAIASASEPPRVVLDLAGADLLDAVGLGVVLEGVKRTAVGGGGLALARPEPHVRRELELTRLVEILPVHESIDAAIDALVD